MKYEINKEIVFSTGHITKEDTEELDWLSSSSREGFIVYPYEYGYRIWVNHELKINENLSDAFWNTLSIAKYEECKWLVFDFDGCIYPFLEQFDW